MLEVGAKAPDFTLMSDEEKEVSLSDFLGKKDVVLYFYPKDNTPGCTKEACSFRDNLPQIEARNAVVIGVSKDSVKSHQNFKKKHDLNFILLSDPEHKVAEAYGAWGEKKNYGKVYYGTIRSTFLIGKDGIIKKVFKKVNTKIHGEEVLEVL
ncbi:thioredoxin-dependent thiol peroxidase [candidate division KSB1 bacterium 4484_87]|nr:MAG: thioredoxin-dependent thiol peroxidase [candidate division KSB1 bacterium 4484_87]